MNSEVIVPDLIFWEHVEMQLSGGSCHRQQRLPWNGQVTPDDIRSS